MKTASKKQRKPLMRINARVEYALVWGDCGVEWHSLGGIMSCEHSSDEALVMLMNSVVINEKPFLAYHSDDHGRIHWKQWQWKEVGEKDYRTESLRLFNQPGITKPIIDATTGICIRTV